jgi:GDSL-like Lipase/Acylhydrolase family
MRRRRFVRPILFGVCAAALATIGTLGALFALDLYLHKRAERSAGLNMWGYRGPVVGRKQRDEVRVAVLGGSSVFGYGLTWDRAFPALLEQKLNARADRRTRFSVVNLGYNSEGAFSFRYTLEDYAYLEPDIVCLYEGYNDLMGDQNGGNPAVYRHSSPLFRATGYFPILPLVFREKAMALRNGGHLNDAYIAEGKTVFQPTLAARATSGALDAAARLGDSIEREVARLGADRRPPVVQASGRGCAAPWHDYCQSVATAVDYALGSGRRVLFVTQPYLTGERGRDRHVWQQSAVAAMVRERYAGRREFHYVDLSDAVDLRDAALAFDGMHLTPDGNARVADRLVQPVLDGAAFRPEPSA